MFILLLCIAEIFAEEAHYFQPRIINGADSRPGEFPYAVSLQTEGHVCGGTLIAPDWVLTAGHCVSQVSYFDAWVGKWQLSDASSGQMIDAEFYVRPADYNDGSSPYSNNIALIKLRSPSTGTPLARATAADGDFSGASCTIIGWGRTEPTGDISDILQKYTSAALSDAACSDAWGANVDSRNICIGGDGGACNADSGSAMICNNRLAGVASFGPSGCSVEFPSVYSRVSAFESWISEKMAQYS